MSVTADLERMPGWVKFLLGIVVPLAGVAATWGALQANQTAIENRLTREIVLMEERLRRTEQTIEQQRGAIERSQLDIVRICSRVKCKE